MRKGSSLIEIIFVILIIGIVSTYLLMSISKYYKEFDKNNRFAILNNESRMTIEQLNKLLSNRLSYSMIGYNSNSNTYESLYNLNSVQYPIFEWISYSQECLDRDTYRPFIDLDASNVENISLNVPYIDIDGLNKCLYDKWDQNDTAAISFAGLFDEGEIHDSSLYQNYFGWHNGNHELIFTINKVENNFIYLNEKPKTIYERFYLIDSSYAIAKGSDINLNAECIQNLDLNAIDNNTLFLFSNYRSWDGETFCADYNGNRSGDVSILMLNNRGFRISIKNGSPIIFINSEDNGVIVSKEKRIL